MASESLNTAGYSNSLKAKVLPEPTHITHGGIFNETLFEVGERSGRLTDIHHGVAISNCDLYDLPSQNYFLSLFLKSSTDGQRRVRPLNVVVVLDVSGSMEGALNYNQEAVVKKMSRLDLSRKAIEMLFDKLQPEDVFSLVTFHNTAQTIIKSGFTKYMQKDKVKQKIYSQFESGGTTIAAGVYEALDNLENFAKDFTLSLNYENRIVILTDVCDNSVAGQQKLIQQISRHKNISTTIIGVSSQFRSQTCEKLIEVKGFNYFCAVQQSDLQTYLADQFDYTFFQCVQDVQISLQSEQIQSIDVFGSVDHKTKYQKTGNKIIVTKMKSMFPSALELKNGICQTKGGLILVKMNLGQLKSLPHLKAKIQLSYSDMQLRQYNNVYQIDNKVTSEEYYSDQASMKGVRLFYYTQTVKNLLRDMKEGGENALKDENKGHYLSKLNKLQQYCPESKKKELQMLVEIVEKK